VTVSSCSSPGIRSSALSLQRTSSPVDSATHFAGRAARRCEGMVKSVDVVYLG
jgi:hypothetical protein